jgi:hypothetical protein
MIHSSGVLVGRSTSLIICQQRYRCINSGTLEFGHHEFQQAENLRAF